MLLFITAQDGTCNGLQHYAALGRDVEGGANVNLVPLEHPQDAYKKVADMVQVIEQALKFRYCFKCWLHLNERDEACTT